MKRVLVVGALVMACGKSEAPPSSSVATPAAAPAPAASAAGGCPANGAWAECSVIYRLERSGLAPRIDSTARPSEKVLRGRPLLLKIGASARLDVYLYADTASRSADAAKLDRKELLSATAPQTIKRERTLIESANLIGLLTSINAHQRERVSDALVAGPPQPEQPQMLKPVKSNNR